LVLTLLLMLVARASGASHCLAIFDISVADSLG